MGHMEMQILNIVVGVVAEKDHSNNGNYLWIYTVSRVPIYQIEYIVIMYETHLWKIQDTSSKRALIISIFSACHFPRRSKLKTSKYSACSNLQALYYYV